MNEETHPTASGPVSKTPPEPAAPASQPEKRYQNAEKRLIEFGKGLTISLLVNVMPALIYLIYLGFESFAYAENAWYHVNTSFFMRFGGIWLLGNFIVMIILVIIALAINRQEILKGMLVGYAFIFLITIILGLGLTAACLNPKPDARWRWW